MQRYWKQKQKNSQEEGLLHKNILEKWKAKTLDREITSIP